LVYREAWCLCALAVLAHDLHLRGVLAELVAIVEAKRTVTGDQDIDVIAAVELTSLRLFASLSRRIKMSFPVWVDETHSANNQN